MRIKKSTAEITVRAIAGTYVVSLAMDATESARRRLLGFAIYRVDQTEHEEYWLKGMRTFEETTPPNLPPGTLVSTNAQPVQDFAWGDFTAKPAHRYVYRVHPVYGRPRFRGIVNQTKGRGPQKPNYLVPDPTWANDYYRKGSVKYSKRTTLVR